MKQIPLLQGKALLIELPEKHEAAFKALRNGRELTINRKNKSANVDHIMFDFEFAEQLFNHGLLDCTSGSLDTGDRHYLFGLGWRIIGMLSEVTNAELADVTGFYYNKYNERYVEMPTSAMRATPIGDIEDAILAEGYYLDENPIAVPDFSGGNIRFSETVEYAKAQSRVLDRSRCLLLGREGAEPERPECGKYCSCPEEDIYDAVADYRKNHPEPSHDRHISGWTHVSDALPEHLETVWLSNGKGFTTLGCLVWTEDGWHWAATNGVIYEENGRIVSECESDDIDVEYWHRLPDALRIDKEVKK